MTAEDHLTLEDRGHDDVCTNVDRLCVHGVCTDRPGSAKRRYELASCDELWRTLSLVGRVGP